MRLKAQAVSLEVLSISLYTPVEDAIAQNLYLVWTFELRSRAGMVMGPTECRNPSLEVQVELQNLRTLHLASEPSHESVVPACAARV